MSENAGAEPIAGSAGSSWLAGFFEEATNLWRRLPHKILFLVLFGAWIALFEKYGNATMGYAQTSSLFAWANSVWVAMEADEHGAYIPYVVLIFLWLRRRELAKASGQIWWPAVIYFAIALGIHLVAFRIQQARVSVLAFILGLHALIGLVWGREALKRSVFPIFLLLYCIPLGSIADIITFDLRLLVTKVSVGIGHNILGIEVFRDGSQIIGPGGKPLYDVAPACSGMRSIIALNALSVIYAFLNFNSIWRRAALILSSVPLAVLGNIVRITTVILVGDIFGKDAGAMIEQKFGFITFAVAIGGLIGIGRLLREKDWEPEPASVESTTAPAPPLWTPQELKLAGVVLVAIVAAAAALNYGKPRLGNPGLAFEKHSLTNELGKVVREERIRLPDNPSGFNSMDAPITKMEEETLPKDTSYGRKLYWDDAGFWTQMSAIMMKTDRTSIHRPQVCVTGAGWHIDRTETIDIPIASPAPYTLSATCLTVSKVRQEGQRKYKTSGLYVYWFVSENRLAAAHPEALWFITQDLITTGVLYPWAYVSCFTVCEPGREAVALAKVKRLIATTTPSFQLTAGKPKESAFLGKQLSLQ